MGCFKQTELCIGSGDDLRVIVEVYDESGSLVDISGASGITWSVAPNVNSAAVITKTLGAGISINTPTSFVFDILPADTSALQGSYYHEAEIITSGAKTYTAMSGRFLIKPTLI